MNRGLLVMSCSNHRTPLNSQELSSQVFDCIDIVDQIVLLFGLLEICQEKLNNPSEELDKHLFLLMDSFFIQVEPSIAQLRCKLRCVFEELR
jgi:hypothetical protein